MQSDISEMLASLQEDYAKHLPKKVLELETLWLRIIDQQEVNCFEELVRAAHTIHGTAGTYGYHLSSSVANRLEKKLNEVDSNHLSPADIEAINNLIQDLKQISLHPKVELKQGANKHAYKHLPAHGKNEERILYILGKDAQALHAQFDQLKNYNYHITIYQNLDKFLEIVFANHPSIIFIDIYFAQQISHEQIQLLRKALILIIYLSQEDSLEKRLLAVRQGGQSFMHIPCALEQMTRMIDNLFEARRLQTERILIMDDSLDITKYYSLILESAGMLVEAINDPLLFLNQLQEFQPDIILMDINMPHVNGMELAQVVQQQENLSGIPIIFLSTISERSKQLEALSYAGDDFITKPIEPAYLVAAVRNRLMRSRIIRSRMIRDSLTNLYNHTMIQHHLEREMAIAERYDKSVCAALIDIDHFKMVNDTYGHQAGDKILHELSNYLQTHLRISDVVGRYGGEEFLIVLPDTSLKNGFKIINQLREHFANIEHNVGETSICVSFSAGIACYPGFKNISSLIKASDEALYLAKSSGRNRVITNSN